MSGPVSCTQTTQNPDSGNFLPYVQNCTVTISFTPMYPGGHRDALFVFDTDGNTVLTGAFLYGIGLAPQLMIQPGVTTNLHLSGYPYLYGSTVDEAGNYYVYSNNDFYKVTEQGVASVYATSVPEADMLSIDGAGNLFSNHASFSSGYELGNASPSSVLYGARRCEQQSRDHRGNRLLRQPECCRGWEPRDLLRCGRRG